MVVDDEDADHARILVVSGKAGGVQRDARLDGGTDRRFGMDVEGSAELLGALTHGRQAYAVVTGLGQAMTVVADSHDQLVVFDRDRRKHAGSVRVADGVGQGLLCDAEGGDLGRRRQLR